jgi:hypothetical protein
MRRPPPLHENNIETFFLQSALATSMKKSQNEWLMKHARVKDIQLPE